MRNDASAFLSDTRVNSVCGKFSGLILRMLSSSENILLMTPLGEDGLSKINFEVMVRVTLQRFYGLVWPSRSRSV
uniref:Uncharacterized protein n=1 Tax=Anguilla anguilla TaxID=7936 RepID=A0A0E9PUT5_ANGAN